MDDETRAEWKRHLAPELRAHFERVGEESVQFDVSHHNYSSPEKHMAALYWLGEKRIARDRREKVTLLLVAVGAVFALLGLLKG